MANAEVCFQWLDEGTKHLVLKADPELFDHPINDRWLDNFVASSTHHMALAIADGQLIGFASGVTHLNPDKPTELYLSELSVLPDHRLKGIGSSLVRVALDWAKSAHYAGVWVLTDADNYAAQATYGAADKTNLMSEKPILFNWDL
ncbi:MAG: GNAT family N-acetyltransferase [Pseudomonadota bacterium]